MDERIKEALGQLSAPQAVKDQAWEKLSGKLSGRRPSYYRWATAACSLLAAVGLAALGAWMMLTPTAFLSVDVNPSLELGLNRFGMVVKVDPYNDDGEVLAETLDAQWRNYADVVEDILALDVVNSDGSLLTFTVAGNNETQCQNILQQVEADSAGCDNVQCHGVSLEEREEAHEAGMSFGKYRMYQAIAQLDPSFTVEEAQGMTMAQLQQLLESLGGELTSGPGSGYGQGQGMGQGQGAGQGQGEGQGQNSNQDQTASQSGGQGQHHGQGMGPGQGQGMGQGQGRGKQSGEETSSTS